MPLPLCFRILTKAVPKCRSFGFGVRACFITFSQGDPEAGEIEDGGPINSDCSSVNSFCRFFMLEVQQAIRLTHTRSEAEPIYETRSKINPIFLADKVSEQPMNS
jgi:hypothetical protein